MFSNLELNRSLVGQNTHRFMAKSSKQVSDSSMLSEWEEIQAAQKDPKKFRPLYERYFEAIFAFIQKRTGDTSLSGDICSQVFLKAMQKLDKYKFKGVPFSAWLYRIAHNEVAQHFRNNSKQRVVSIEENQIDELIDELDYDFKKDVLQDLLVLCLDQLSPAELNLIELRFFDKKPFKEIATILDITESNAKEKTYRITKKMKTIILKAKS